MHWRRLCVISCYLIAHVLLGCKPVNASCPFLCTCDIDDLGRKRTRCDSGGISIPGNVDIATVDYDTQVLILSGSVQRPNNVALTQDMFRNKPYLQEIHVTQSQLTDIGIATFELVSDTLQVLNLTGNNLEVLIDLNFRNLSQLTHLHLDYNRIESFHSAMFTYLISLRVLTISANRVRITRCSSSASCGSLLPRLGVPMPKLNVLDLSGNSIGPTVPDMFFQDLTGLRVLNLSRNGLENVPWRTMQNDNTNMEELDLSRNSIMQIFSGQVSLLPTLKRLNLSGNPLTYIAAGAFASLVLEDLDLSNISQSILGQNVFLNCRIVSLNLSDMGLKLLASDTFRPIAQDLLALDLSGNENLVLGLKMFSFLPELRVLVMQRMHLTELPRDIFDYANHIESVDISHNAILSLDDQIFSSLKNLISLDLSKNQIRSVPSSVAQLPLIQQLDLSDNRLATIPDSVAQALSRPGTSIKSLHLNTNPWTCGCNLSTLTQWLNVTQSGPAGYQAVCTGNSAFTCPVCYLPATLRGITLDRVKLPPCETNRIIGAQIQNNFPQSWSTSPTNEPRTASLTAVFVNNTFINNAVISSAVLRNTTYATKT